MEDYDRVLYIHKEVYVYQIPPRMTAKGYKASDWDVNNYIWSGRLRILANNSNATIVLEDATDGSLFASSPFDINSNTLEQVTDSSRYFVLKVVDQNTGILIYLMLGNHAFIGIGFPERSSAFDFQIALQDFNRSNSVQKMPKEDGPKVDFSLKEGQTISLSLGTNSKTQKSQKESDKNLENCNFILFN